MSSRTKQAIIKIIAGAVAVSLISLGVGCNAKSDSKNVCKTPGCTAAADKVLELIDEKINPCDNFYKFACGKYLKTAKLSDDRPSISVRKSIDDNVDEQVKAILEEKIQLHEPKSFREAKSFYKSCMDTASFKRKGMKPLLEKLKLLGGWPVLDGTKWPEKDFDWTQAVYKRRKLGYPIEPFFAIGTNMDPKKNQREILFIDQISLSIPREQLVKGMNDKAAAAYYKYMVDTAVILGANKTRAEKELKESFEFETKLARITVPEEERKDPSKLYNQMTIKQLSEKYTSIPWKEYINTIFKLHKKIGDNEIVIVKAPSYFKEFEKLMKQTPKRTQSNYAMWKAIFDYDDYLPENIRKREFQYLVEITGQKKVEISPRWKDCKDYIFDNIRIPVDALYVKKYLNKEAKKKALDMVNDIQKEFQKILEKVDWMDSGTRKKALDKARAMIKYVGYPDELLNDKIIEEFYKNLEITDDDYFQASLNMSIFQTDNFLSNYRKPESEWDWYSYSPSTVPKVEYIASDNSINIPACMLQNMYYSVDRPQYMNYAAIGHIIGHEITHGFDEKGHQFDKDGNMNDWWEKETKKKFLSKAQCVINQYGNYTIEGAGVKVNGISTQADNIAEMGGIKVAYLAYQEWVKKHGAEPMLPKLKYSPSQLFWISAANLMCTKERPEIWKDDFHKNPNKSPAEFRVVGPLSNMPEFAKDFNCPVNSKMNPTKKCSVW